MEKSTGHALKCLRTDNGGEYTSLEFKTYLAKEGIRHELTVPKTPEQNGTAERMNRTLVESVRSMLADSKLPHRFWAEALSTAVYLRNRSPTKVLQGITPIEAWTGKKPDVSSLRIFGCTAYAHVPKDERQKLDSKARKCFFLGYGTDTKGYRLYDPSRARIIHSRDVLFNELGAEVEKEKSEKEKSEHHEMPEQQERKYMEVEVESGEPSGGDDSSSPDSESAMELVPRRSERDRRNPNRYGDWVAYITTDLPTEPSTLKEALGSQEAAEWQEAMKMEMDSLHSNDVWDLVKLPEGRKVIGSKWVFKRKLSPDGTVQRHKARLVAQGFSQKFGLDYEETFSPVVRFESVRMVIAAAAQHGLKLHQMDVTTAFLNGELQDEVYMKQPEGFIAPGQEDLVCKLKRSIYGLKQSPRCWNHVLDSHLKGMGFTQTASDPCLYVASEGELFIIAVYVDDIGLAAKSDQMMDQTKKALAKRFEMKDLGILHHFLGVKVDCNLVTGEVWIGQPVYTEKLLQKFGMEHSKPVSTPVNTDAKLIKKTEAGDDIDQRMYQAAVGSLLYLSTKTRPDIAFAVGKVARFCAGPAREHWEAVKRILRYLRGTSNSGLLYCKSDSSGCVGFSDADWGGDHDDRKSTSGYVFLMGGTAVSWKSNKQSCVALSTAEAEYVALAAAAQEAKWLQRLTSDLLDYEIGATEIFEDNQSAICLAKTPQFHGRTKHIEIKYHFIRDEVESGNVKLEYCRSEDMIADMLTKGLPITQFVKLRQMIGIADFEHSTCN